MTGMAADKWMAHSYITASGSEVYLRLLADVLEHGTDVTARGMPTREFRSVTVALCDSDDAHVLKTSRKPSLKIAATEAMHLIGGISSLEQLNLASDGRFTRFADNGRLKGAYGPRAALQLLMAERLLKEDPGTRQAGVTIWKGNETAVQSKDVPCTTSLHFYLRDGFLELDVTMRSNDILLGFPIDIMMFSCLHRTMAASLGVPAGVYRHHTGSLHAYVPDLPRLEAIIKAGLGEQQGMPIPLPVPYFTIGTHKDLSFSLMALKARELCLRPGDDGFSDRAWLTQRVPCLGPGWGWCPLCRYAVRENDSCASCTILPPSGDAHPFGSESPGSETASASAEELRPYIGRYVAVRDGKVIADAADISGVITSLRERGLTAQAAFRVPSAEVFT